LVAGPITRGRAAALVLVQVLWANCHALSVLGIVVLGSELAGALGSAWLPAPWRTAGRRGPGEVRALAWATAGGVVAEALTPFGVAGALFPLRLLTVLRGG